MKDSPHCTQCTAVGHGRSRRSGDPELEAGMVHHGGHGVGQLWHVHVVQA